MSILDKRNKVHNLDSSEKVDIPQSIIDEYCGSEDADAVDGGWGWVVVFASFMVHVLTDGVTYSFGALATEFVTHFDASRESVGWMASILVGMTFTTGPLISILCNKFGFRTVTMAGAIISAVGFAAPFFYPKFWFLYLASSVVTGIGFGMVYLPSIVTVSIYFQKKRAFAIGLAVCGSGIGTFVFSPLIEYFNETYGWQGSMLIVGGLILNCLACGAVYRPIRFTEQSISAMSSRRSSNTKLGLNKNTLSTESNQISIDRAPTNRNIFSREFTSVNNVAQSLIPENNKMCFFSTPNMHLAPHLNPQSQKKNLFKVSHPHLLISSQISLQISHRHRLDTNHSNVVRPALSDNSVSSSEPSKDELRTCLDDIFDKELLLNPIFLLFAFSNFFTSVGFNAPFLYAKDRALEVDIPNNYASFLISSIGIGNTFGRIIFGYMSTKSFVNRLQLYNGSLMISGLVVIFSSFAVTYPWMIVYTLAFGVLTGTYVTLTSVVLVDLLGIEKLNASFGMTMVFQGVAVFIGPPLAGWIFDQTKSFDCSFWFCGAFLTISGIMLYFVYCSKKFRKNPSTNIENEPC